MCEMIKIMQEYGEVTCCLGSSANLRNSCLFLQSDISIALDPLYPSRCSWETFGYATSTSMAQASDGLSPLQLSGQLNSLPCSLTFRQEETISIIRLIEQVGAQAGGGAGPAWGGLSRLQAKLSQAGWFAAALSSGSIGASGPGLRLVSCRA